MHRQVKNHTHDFSTVLKQRREHDQRNSLRHLEIHVMSKNATVDLRDFTDTMGNNSVETFFGF